MLTYTYIKIERDNKKKSTVKVIARTCSRISGSLSAPVLRRATKESTVFCKNLAKIAIYYACFNENNLFILLIIFAYKKLCNRTIDVVFFGGFILILRGDDSKFGSL